MGWVDLCSNPTGLFCVLMPALHMLFLKMNVMPQVEVTSASSIKQDMQSGHIAMFFNIGLWWMHALGGKVAPVLKPDPRYSLLQFS